MVVQNRRRRQVTKKQKGGDYVCPQGMPPRTCETLKKKHSLPKISRNLRNSIKAAVKLRNWRLLPEEERIGRQKAYWQKFVNARTSTSSGNYNRNNNVNDTNLHEFTNENLTFDNQDDN